MYLGDGDGDGIMDELSEYASQVADAAKRGKNGQSEIIYNRNIEHASILIAELIKGAQKSIKLLSGCANADVYDRKEVLSSLEMALKRSGISVEVILDQRVVGPPNNSTSFLKKIREFETNGGNAVIKNVSIPNTEGEFHFLVVDGASYRYEPNYKKTEAFADFFGKENAQKLEDWFQGKI